MTDAIKLAIEALEDLIESVTGVDQVSAVNDARAALAALRAQPDHSELVKELRLTIGRDRVDDDDNVALVPRWIVEQAADALEGKAIGGKA